jgi:serine protease inhibitor
MIKLELSDNDLVMIVTMSQDNKSFLHEVNLRDIIYYSGIMLKSGVNSDNFTPTLIDLGLPKINCEVTHDFCKVLESIGIKNAFDERKANFEKIRGSNYGDYLNIVEQKIQFRLNEGSELVEKTETEFISSNTLTTKPKQLIFNCPFIITIIHKPTLTPIFVGNIMNPIS